MHIKYANQKEKKKICVLWLPDVIAVHGFEDLRK